MLEYAIALLLAKEGSAFTLSRVAVHMFEYAIALLLAKEGSAFTLSSLFAC